MTYGKRSLAVVLGGLVFIALAAVSLPADPAGASASQPTAQSVAAACARCGDGVCARSCENERTCPADCAPQPAAVTKARCGKCGDGSCVPQCGETSQSCPADCGGTPVPAAAGTSAGTCDPARTDAARPDPKKD